MCGFYSIRCPHFSLAQHCSHTGVLCCTNICIAACSRRLCSQWQRCSCCNECKQYCCTSAQLPALLNGTASSAVFAGVSPGGQRTGTCKLVMSMCCCKHVIVSNYLHCCATLYSLVNSKALISECVCINWCALLHCLLSLMLCRLP